MPEFSNQQDLVRYLSLGDDNERTEEVSLPALEGLFYPVPTFEKKYKKLKEKILNVPEFGLIQGKTLVWAADLLTEVIAKTEGICELEWEWASTTVIVRVLEGFKQITPTSEESFQNLSGVVRLILGARGGLQKIHWNLGDSFVTLKYRPLFFA